MIDALLFLASTLYRRNWNVIIASHLVFTYGLMLAMVFTGSNQLIQGFPDPGQGAAGLLGISQAAYLANKVVPRPAAGSDSK